MEWLHLHPKTQDFQAREVKILEIISKNPDIHHNELLRIIEEKKLMAKRTAEKNIRFLLERGIIISHEVGNQKQYAVNVGVEQFDPEKLEKSIIIWSKFDAKELEKLEKVFPKLSIEHKAGESLMLIKLVMQNIAQLSLLNSLHDPKQELYKKEIIQLKKSIRKIIDTIRKDKDYKIIYPLIMEQAASRKIEFGLDYRRPDIMIKS